MFLIWLIFLLTWLTLLSVSLVSAANGPAPAPLKIVQDILKPVAGPLTAIIGTVALVAIIWGGYMLIQLVLGVLAGGFSFRTVLDLLTAFLLIVLGTLAGYTSVAAFFGAPASGAGKFFDGIKRSFGGIEGILGLVGLLLALWMLIEFILARFGVYL